MSNRQIITKAIHKVILNGWKLLHPIHSNESIEEFIEECYRDIYIYPYNEMVLFNSIVYTRSFAEALWGENEEREINISYSGYCLDDEGNTNEMIDITYRIKEWQYHLQQMVVKEDPFQYLKKFV